MRDSKGLKTEGCVFCDISSGSDQIIQETKSFRVIINIFPYSYWDDQGVVDHLMIIPKQHTDTLSDLSAPESVEFIDLLSSWESKGYDFTARAPGSNRKTVIHQHTHLLKLDRKTKKFTLYSNRPYINISY